MDKAIEAAYVRLRTREPIHLASASGKVVAVFASAVYRTERDDGVGDLFVMVTTEVDRVLYHVMNNSSVRWLLGRGC